MTLICDKKDDCEYEKRHNLECFNGWKTRNAYEREWLGMPSYCIWTSRETSWVKKGGKKCTL
jgi:hypothetical protein